MKNFTIKRKKYPVAFNMIAAEEFCILHGIDLAGLDKLLLSGRQSDLFKLFHFSMEYGARRDGKELDLTIDGLADLIGFDPVTIQKCTEVFLSFFPENEPSQKNITAKKKTRRRSVSRN